MEFLQAFTTHLETQGVSKLTIKNYLADIRKFIRFIEETYSRPFALSDFTGDTIAAHKASLQSQKASLSSQERYLSSLRKFATFLHEDRKIPFNPFSFSEAAKQEEDRWALRDFKQDLLRHKASDLTIKNYILDIKQFLAWLEEVDKNISKDTPFSSLTTTSIEEYKARLLHEMNLSPLSVNRKLSSIRKYAGFLIQSERISTQPLVLNTDSQVGQSGSKESSDAVRSFEQITPSNHTEIPQSIPLAPVVTATEAAPETTEYSAFAPVRLSQKLAKLFRLGFDAILIIPIIALVEKALLLFRKAQGMQGLFEENKSGKKSIFSGFEQIKAFVKEGSSSSHLHNFVTSDPRTAFKGKISNLSKAFYAPLDISATNLPRHKKILHHLRYTRPDWYKKYHSYAIAHYLNFAILMIFITVIGASMYSVFFDSGRKSPALAALPTAPPRILSFQGRLTDSVDNPITATKNVRFAIYDDITATGSGNLLWQELQQVTPDADGVFSVLMGNTVSTCSDPLDPATGACAIPSTLFSQNATLYLGITIENDTELSPRQQVASVAYAVNSETLQGLPPSTAAGAGETNVVLALDSSGNLTIGGSATPTFQASGGQFTLSGTVLNLTTTTGSNSNIQLNPDGSGKNDFQKAIINSTLNGPLTTAAGAVQVDDLFAVNATSSGQSAFTLNQDGTGPLISASASGVSKFAVGNDGTGYFAGNVGVGTTSPTAKLQVVKDGTLPSQTPQLKLTGATNTNYNLFLGYDTTSNFGYIQPIQVGTSYTNLILNGSGGNVGVGTTTASSFKLEVAGNVGPSADVTYDLGSASKRWNNIYAANIIGGSSGVQGFWQLNSGALSPYYPANDLLLGATATTSAKFAFLNNAGVGNPTASISGNFSLSSPTGSAPTVTQNVLNGGTLNFQTSVGGDAGLTSRLYITNNGNIGISTTTSSSKLDIQSTAVNTDIQRWMATDGSRLGRFTETSGGAGWFEVDNASGTAQALLRGDGGVSYITGGNVGIGTTAAANFLLQAAGSIGPSATNTYDLGSASLQWNNVYGNNFYQNGVLVNLTNYWQRALGAVAPYNITDDVLVGGTATASALIKLGGTTNASTFFNTGGTVGIGTTATTERLNIGAGSILLDNTYGIKEKDSGGTVRTIFSYTSANNLQFTNAASSGSIQFTNQNASGSIIFYTGSSANEALRVDPNGNVGIGTTSPFGKLNVVGNSTTPIGKAALVVIQNETNGDLFTASAGATTRFVINNAGNVGIGTSLPGAALDVNGNILTQGGGSIDTRAAGTLGIGTTTQTGLTLGRSGATTTINSSALTLGQFTTNGGLLYTNGSGVVAQTGAGTSTTVLHGGTTPSYSAVSLTADVSGTLPVANGGTNSTATPTNGGVAYGTGTAYAFTAAGSSGYVLQSNGAAAPTWIDPAALSTSYWNLASGAIYPKNATVDLLIGGSATTSAKFGFINVNSGTPIASISANSGNNGIYLTGDGTLGRPNRGDLTLGNSSTYNTTGNILLSPNGTGNVGIGTTAAGAKLDIAGNLLINNGGTIDTRAAGTLGIGTATQTGLTLGRSGATTTINSSSLTLGQFSTNGGLLYTNGSGVVSQTGAGTSTTVLHGGTTPTYGAVVLTTDVSGTLPIANGGTNSTATPTNGGIAYGTGTAYAFSLAGTSGQVLLSGGAGAPSWSNTNTSAFGLWDLASGAIYPKNATTDLLIGGNATTSAKFGFINVAGGTPTATISGNFGLQVPTGSAPAISQNILNGGTFNLKTSVGGDAGLTSRLFIANNGNLGVGTTNPIHTTEVIGDTLAGGNVGIEISGTTIRGGTSASGIAADYNLVINANSLGGTLALQAGSTTQVLLDASSGNLGLAGVTSPSSFRVQSGGSIGPNTNNAYDLGSTSLQWRNIYASGSICFAGGTDCTSSFSTLGVNYWNLTSGTIQPKNATVDLLIGGTATTSAKFGFINVNSGTPTATISGNFAIATPTGSAPTVTQNVLNGGALNFQTSVGGDAGLTTRLSINNNGNVGIGSTTPGSKLDVNGQITGGFGAQSTAGTLDWNDISNTKSGNGYTLLLGNASNGPGVSVYYHPFNFEYGTKSGAGNITQLAIPYGYTSGIDQGISMRGSYSGTWSNWVKIISENTSGNVAIGTTSSVASKLHVYGTTTGNALVRFDQRTSGADIFTASASGTTKFVINYAGNVGIGTGVPGQELDVNGDILVGAGSTIDARSAGTITIGGSTQTGLTLGRSGAATTINSSALTLGQFSTNGGLLYTNGSGVVSQTGAGTATTILHGGTTPTYGAVVLTTDVSGTLPIANGGTNSTATPTNGGVAYGTGTAYAFTSAGTSGQVLLSGGAGAPSWSNTNTSAFGLWDLLTGGILTPKNATTDLLLGGTATSSARIGFLNIAGGNPTASLSGNLAISSPTGSAPSTGFLVLNGGSLNFKTSVGGDAGATTRLSIANDGTLTASKYILNGGLLYTDGSGVINQTTVGSNGQCLQSIGGGTPAWGSCGGASYWTASNGLLYPTNATLDLAIGGTSSTAAKFTFTNVNTGTPAFRAYNSGSTQYVQLNHDGTNANITASTGTINIGAGGGTLYVNTDIKNDSTNFAGFVKIADKLLVQGSTEASHNALAIFDNTLPGDILTASASGTTKFVIDGNGNVGIGTTLPGNLLSIVSTSSFSQAIGLDTNTSTKQAGIGFSSAGSQRWQLGKDTDDSFYIYDAVAARTDFNIGSNGNMQLMANGGNVGIGTTSPVGRLNLVTSASSLTGKAAFILNQNEGNIDLFTASASGTTRFRLTNGGSAIATDFYDINDLGRFLNPAGDILSASLSAELKTDYGGISLGDFNVGTGTTITTYAGAGKGNFFTAAGSLITAFGGIGRSENFLRYSEQFDKSASIESNTNPWALSSPNGPTITANNSGSCTNGIDCSPDGQQTADKMLGGSSTNTISQTYRSTTTEISGNPWTFSVWIKNGTATGTVNITLTDGFTTSTTPISMDDTVTNRWNRYFVTMASPNGSATTMKATIDLNGNSSNIIYLWGAQLERQSSVGNYLRTSSQRQTTTLRGLVAGTTTGGPSVIMSGNDGIATPSANTTLLLAGAGGTYGSGADNNILQIYNNSANASNNVSEIGFLANRPGTISEIPTQIASISAIMTTNSGSAWAGALAFSTAGTGAQPTERMRIDATGNIGIGTTAPNLTGDTGTVTTIYNSGTGTVPGVLELASGTTTNTAPAGRLSFVANASSTKRVAFIDSLVDTSNANYGGNLRFFTKAAGGGEAVAMTILGTGNVGIGTTTGTNKLDVSAGVAIGSYAGVNAAPSNGLIVSGNVGIGTTTASNEKLEVAGAVRPSGNGSSVAYVILDGLAFRSGTAAGNAYMDVGTLNIRGGTGSTAGGTLNVSQNAYLASSGGNVGIGTTTVSSEKFRVISNDNTGSTNIADFLALNETQGIGIGYANIRSTGSNSNIDLNIDGKGTGNLFLQGTATGNVGIGTTTASSKLYVKSTVTSGISYIKTGAADARISVGDPTKTWSWSSGWSTAGDLSLIEEGVAGDVMAIKQGGNIGFGTTTIHRKFVAQGSVAGGTPIGFLNADTADNSGSGVIALGTGATATTTNVRFIKFFAGSTDDNFSGTGVGRIQLNNNNVAYNTGGADFGEWIDMGESSEFGDIIGYNNNKGIKATSKSALLGVASDTTGFTGNVKAEDLGANQQVVGFLGQIRTKVSNLNGLIKKGDMVTASSIPGVGQKSTTAGEIVGKALEDFDPNNASQTISCPAGTSSGVTCGKIMLYVNPSWYDPDVYITDTGDLNVTGSNGTYAASNQGSLSSRIGVFATAAIARLKAGMITVSELTAQALNVTGTLTTQSLAIASSNVTIAGQSINDFIDARVNSLLDSRLSSLTSPLASSSATVTAGRVIIKSPIATTEPVLDVTGNASISGSIATNNLTTNTATISGSLSASSLSASKATISGTLHATNIIADNITSLSAQIATLSATTIVNNFTTTIATMSGETASSSADFLASLYANGIQTNFMNVASLSATSGFVPTLNSDFVTVNQGLIALGPTSLADTSIAGTLSVNGNLILSDSSINVLGADLQIQPLRQGGVSFEGGQIAFDTDGNMRVSGDANFAKNVTVGGALATNYISALPGSDVTVQLQPNHDFIIANASGSASFRVNNLGDVVASGSASFRELLANGLNIVRGAQADDSITETTASGSAGTAIINAYQTERTINTPYVTAKSLIYITPTSDTQGVTPYVSRQTAEDPDGLLGNGPTHGSFTIEIPNNISDDIKLNWWIVN